MHTIFKEQEKEKPSFQGLTNIQNFDCGVKAFLLSRFQGKAHSRKFLAEFPYPKKTSATLNSSGSTVFNFPTASARSTSSMEFP